MRQVRGNADPDGRQLYKLVIGTITGGNASELPISSLRTGVF